MTWSHPDSFASARGSVHMVLGDVIIVSYASLGVSKAISDPFFFPDSHFCSPIDGSSISSAANKHLELTGGVSCAIGMYAQ